MGTQQSLRKGRLNGVGFVVGDCVGGRRLVAQGSPEKQNLFWASWGFFAVVVVVFVFVCEPDAHLIFTDAAAVKVDVRKDHPGCFFRCRLPGSTFWKLIPNKPLVLQVPLLHRDLGKQQILCSCSALLYGLSFQSLAWLDWAFLSAGSGDQAEEVGTSTFNGPWTGDGTPTSQPHFWEHVLHFVVTYVKMYMIRDVFRTHRSTLCWSVQMFK